MLIANQVRLSRKAVAPCYTSNRRAGSRVPTSVVSASSTDSKSTTALSITASAAASALLAKVAALLASGAALPAILHSSSTAFKGSAEEIHSASAFQGALADKVAVISAPAPAATSPASALAVPVDWLLICSSADWFAQHRRAVDAGALLATVFISDAAALAHAPLLERLRRNFGAGPDAPVRFVFVRIEDDYQRRHRACAAAAASSALARGTGGPNPGRVSHIAALHGLDVALTSFLPDGVRAFPSLLLTAGPATANSPSSPSSPSEGAPWSWCAATRVGELTQLVSDWAFITEEHRRRHPRHHPEEEQRHRRLAAAVEGEGEGEGEVSAMRSEGAGARRAASAAAPAARRLRGDTSSVSVLIGA